MNLKSVQNVNKTRFSYSMPTCRLPFHLSLIPALVIVLRSFWEILLLTKAFMLCVNTALLDKKMYVHLWHFHPAILKFHIVLVHVTKRDHIICDFTLVTTVVVNLPF